MTISSECTSISGNFNKTEIALDLARSNFVVNVTCTRPLSHASPSVSVTEHLRAAPPATVTNEGCFVLSVLARKLQYPCNFTPFIAIRSTLNKYDRRQSFAPFPSRRAYCIRLALVVVNRARRLGSASVPVNCKFYCTEINC